MDGWMNMDTMGGLVDMDTMGGFVTVIPGLAENKKSNTKIERMFMCIISRRSDLIN
jgi:hypothetical protein